MIRTLQRRTDSAVPAGGSQFGPRLGAYSRVWPLSLEPRRLGLAGVVRPQTCHADRLLTGQGKDGAPLQTVFGHAGAKGWRNATPRQCRAAAQERPCPHRRPISSSPSPAPSRGVHRAGYRPPEGEALTEAARAIWRGIEVLEGMDQRARPSAARSVRRALSAAPVPAR